MVVGVWLAPVLTGLSPDVPAVAGGDGPSSVGERYWRSGCAEHSEALDGHRPWGGTPCVPLLLLVSLLFVFLGDWLLM